MNVVPIIPKPNYCVLNNGHFTLTPNAEISYEKEGEIAAQFMKKLTNLKIGTHSVIRLSIDKSINEEEGYQLIISQVGIDIKAKTSVGLLYGAETLRQFFPPQVEKEGITSDIALPFLMIEDAPRFTYRGFMLDVSRHFFDVKTIKSLLNTMVMLKLNRFHWHLTDAQGWRIESKKYPKLTQIGSKRAGTLVYGLLWGEKHVNDKEYGGYYTQEQIKEVVQYAKERGIEVIPEIDMPGHATALLASYPELTCTGEQLKTAIGAKKELDLICAGKESSYTMLFDLLDEIMELFPFKYIHIGGDEADKTRWKSCPKCQAKIKEQGLKNENELQGYFMNRIAEHLESKGCKVICWNDGLSKITEPNMICQYWIFNNKKETVRQVNNGRQLIYSYINGYYLDYAYKNFGLKNSYTVGTGENEFNKNGQKNVIGVEAPLWCEMVYNQDRIDWQMFPRILAVAESAWTVPDQKDYQEFLERLFKFEKRLDSLDVKYTVKECYLKKQKTNFLGFLDALRPGEHSAMREYRKYNEVVGYNKTDGYKV